MVAKLDATVAAAVTARGSVPPGHVRAGLSPRWEQGGVIMGVYRLAGQHAPDALPLPTLSVKGKQLWDRIRTGTLPQYVGYGAYTGFVDNDNTEGETDPVGPRSTARFLVGAPAHPDPVPHPRWLPAEGSPLWATRGRRGEDSRVPWGMIGGENAGDPPQDPSVASNRADEITVAMGSGGYGMSFEGDPGPDDVVGYTHGMIQAIYKAYDLGPSCTPYEIAVGDVTKKLASCIACTLFMCATGYPPTSIHLGRADSWAPLYAPYNPGGTALAHEDAVIRDLNNAWYSSCDQFVRTGLAALTDAAVADSHRAARDAVADYVQRHTDPTVCAVLSLDAVALNDQHVDRLDRTLQG